MQDCRVRGVMISQSSPHTEQNVLPPPHIKFPLKYIRSVVRNASILWVAVKELKLSYYIEETLLFTIYTHYGNLI